MRFRQAALLAAAAAWGAPAAPRGEKTVAPCPARIRFAGLDWIVSDTAEHFPGAVAGFAWNQCNVKLQSLANGKQVLTLTLRKERSGWRGAQLESRRTFQYGTFSMNVESALRAMLVDSPSAVLGFFAYAGPEYSNEIDVELTRWGVARTPVMHYTVWPSANMGTAPPGTSSSKSGTESEFLDPELHRFIWTDQSVDFQSFSGAESKPIGRPFKVTANVPTKPMHIMLNFWVDPHANMGSATSYDVRITSVTRTLP